MKTEKKYESLLCYGQSPSEVSVEVWERKQTQKIPRRHGEAN